MPTDPPSLRPPRAALLVGHCRRQMRSVGRLLCRAGFACDAIASDPRLARSGFFRQVWPFGLPPRWIEAALGWHFRTGGLVVPCNDDLVREARDAAIDEAAKCRLLPVSGPEHLGHVGSKVGLARALEKAGVAAPRFVVVDSSAMLVAACESFGYPLLMKVDESGGGEGVFPCRSRAEAEAIAARSLRLPLLLQEWVDGGLIDLSGFFRGGRPVHFVHNLYLDMVGGRFGVSRRRRYTRLALLERTVFDDLSRFAAALGLDGFANISAVRRRVDGRLLFIEADLRPNVWVEASRLFGDDPAPAIRRCFDEGRVLGWPPPHGPGPSAVDLVYPFRLGGWDLITNRHGVWRTFGEHAPFDLLAHLVGPARRAGGDWWRRRRRG